jgi:predicted PurR-regulated permease PerM
MPKPSDKDPAWRASNITIDLAIRLGLLALLGYWSYRVIAPFATIMLWSALLAVALHPLFEWFTRWLRPWLCAVLVTALCLVVVVGPVTWLGVGMISLIGTLVTELNGGQPAIPLPAESIKTWPIIGERLHQLWNLAATNIKLALVELAPMLKPAGGKLLEIAQGAALGLLQLLASIVIAGFLFPRGPQMASALSVIMGRALSLRGKELVQLVGATVRNVSRGVIGIALLQALLAGAGFLAAGVPAASVLAFLVFLLGILQIGPTILFIPIVVWSWTVMQPIHALMFTAYMVPVGLIDNVLRPLFMARGLNTPMPVIMVGVIGGTIAYGIVGLFFGPVILSVAWAVLAAWLERDDAVDTPPPSLSNSASGNT